MKDKNKKQTPTLGAMLRDFMRGTWGFFAVSVIAAGVTALSDMLIPQIIRAALDNAIGSVPSTYPPAVEDLVARLGGWEYLGEHIWILALGVLLCAGVKVLSEYSFRVFNSKASETLVMRMRRSLFRRIERLPYDRYMKNRTGDLIQRCTSDIDTLRGFISEQMTAIFRIVLLVVLSVTFMLTMNIRLTLISLAPIPLVFGYAVVFHRLVKKDFTLCDENEGKLSAMVQENISGVRLVRAYAAEGEELRRLKEHNEYYTSLWVGLGKRLARYWSTSDILMGLQIMLLLIVGAVMCVKGDLTSGEYVAFISYNSMLTWPVRQLGRLITELSKAGVAADRIYYIYADTEESSPPDALKPDMDGDIEFRDVSLSFVEGVKVLDGLSFTVPAGTTLGILGGTGSGKSSLVMLLDKLYAPDSGSITVSGVDLDKIDTDHLRDNIAFVVQDPYLFSRTVRENVEIALPADSSPGKVEAAAEAACLDRALEVLPKGWDTVVGEKGVTLSGGQRQRVAIARALASRRKIMIFDDSLSAVDANTDAAIRAGLEKSFGEATVIIISHRINTIRNADNILVLEKGRRAQFGDHETLIAQEGIYREVCRAQGLIGEVSL